jgi:tetratricopeptide (TPR) repeat protein
MPRTTASAPYGPAGALCSGRSSIGCPGPPCQNVWVTASWNDRIDRFWESVDDSKPHAAITEMKSLVQEQPAGDPDATYEWASIHDFLGREAEAIPLYREALDNGLSGDRRQRAFIQLASSLRNVGDAQAAVELLQGLEPDTLTGDASRAFLALALHDVGQHDAALRVALKALAPTLPLYGRAISAYADELTGETN